MGDSSWTFRPMVVLLAMLLNASVYATPQVPDLLIYEGKKLGVQGFWLPAPTIDDPEMYVLRKSGGNSSACWRGYVATLKIRGGNLYLVSLDTRFLGDGTVTPERVLGKKIPKQGLVADWFSGTLSHSFGRSYGYLHNSVDGDQLSKARVFEIKAGKVIDVRVINKEKPLELMTREEMDEYFEKEDKKGK